MNKTEKRQQNIRHNYYRVHLDRQRGVRGQKLERLSLSEDLRALGRELGIRTIIDR